MYYNNKRLALSIFWIVLGIVLLALSIAEILDSNMYAGMGGALIAVGFLQVVKNVRYRKNPEYREEVDTAVSDERNDFLRMKSWHWAGIATVMVEGIGVIAAMVLGQQLIQLVLAYSVCLVVGAYWISYMILSRRY